MGTSQVEFLSKQFYNWELWGRGWFLFDELIDLEPPYVPYFLTFKNDEYVDDGKRHSLFSFLGEYFNPKKKPLREENKFERKPFIANVDYPLAALRISFPKGEKISVVTMEHILLMSSIGEGLISFEIIASDILIRFQIVCSAFEVDHIKSQIKAFFPTANILSGKTSLIDTLSDDAIFMCRDFGLTEEFMRPISIVKNLDIDSYTGLIGALGNLKQGENVFIQVLFKGAVNPWSESMIRSVTDYKGDDFFMDAPEMLPATKDKIASSLFGCVLRTICIADNENDADNLSSRISSLITMMSKSGTNKLIPLSHEGVDPYTFISDFELRQSRRLGMILNSKELVNLAHFPSASIHSRKLERELGKTKKAPEVVSNNQFHIGVNRYEEESLAVSLSSEQRLRHMHVIGATGTGKSTFLTSLILNDIHLGNGIAVLDPHGDLIDTILGNISSKRHKDVIVIDPADAEFPVGLNIFIAHSDVEKEVLASDLVGVFRRLSTSWGDQMNSVFSNAILALLESSTGGTLFDLRRFLIEKKFRDSFLQNVTNSNVRYYWEKEFPIVKSNSIGPILTRLDTFLRPKLIRNMVAQKKSINFESAMNKGKILLVKLSQGLIGAENSFLLGSFIVTKIHQAALARQAQSKSERKDFFLYIDEFQHFITPSMSSILSGARKYHLGLILAHQDMQQLVKSDSELASAVISNSGTRVCFRLGDTDAKRFEDGFSFFEAKDLQSLETGRAICRIERPEFDFNLEVKMHDSIEEEIASTNRDAIMKISREKYGTLKSLIEEPYTDLPRENLQLNTDTSETSDIPKIIEVHPTPIEPAVQNTFPEPRSTIPHSEIEKTVSVLNRQKEVSEHRYLQTHIKRMAEARGYKATIEEHIKESNGRVDVSLERDGKRIACEVCMTTTDSWEVHNIEKCLQAGYDLVLECSSNKQILEKIRKKVTSMFKEPILSKILVAEPEVFFQFLDSQIANEASTETRMKGYRVKIEYNPLPPEEIQKKKDEIKKVIFKPNKK